MSLEAACRASDVKILINLNLFPEFWNDFGSVFGFKGQFEVTDAFICLE